MIQKKFDDRYTEYEIDGLVFRMYGPFLVFHEEGNKAFAQAEYNMEIFTEASEPSKEGEE